MNTSANRHATVLAHATLVLFALTSQTAVAQSLGGTSAHMAPPELMRSPHRIAFSQIFHWASPDSGRRHDVSPSSDCMLFEEGLQALRASSTDRVVHISPWDRAYAFLVKAYYGQDFSAYESYATDVVLRYASTGSIEVHVGNAEMNLLCGFSPIQELSAEWAEAGVTGQHVVAPPRPLTDAKQLSAALYGRSYALAVNTMTARGFQSVPSSQPVIERCAIGLETICDAYPNAHCLGTTLSGHSLCEFDWATSESDLYLLVRVNYLGSNYADLVVIGAQPHENN